MQRNQLLRIGTVGVSALLMSGVAHTQQLTGTREDLVDQVKLMKQQLAEQKKMIDSLRQSVTEQRASIVELRDTVGPDVLGRQRGTGPQQGTAPAGSVNADVAQQGDTQPAGGVGRAPAGDGRPPEVAPLFEQPGVLTPKGKFVLEPSVQYGYSSSDRIALVGYTIIPALLIGLIDVREVKVSTTTAALTGRYGLGRRLEVEAKLPYVYTSNSSVDREIATGTAVDNVFNTSGKAIGDVELAARYQLNEGGVDKPYYVAGLRFKSRTGRDPFSIVTDCNVRCIDNTAANNGLTGLPTSLPTGSGFYSLQPSLTWLFPSDPAVFFGSVSYLYNFKRHDVNRLVRNGDMEPLGTIAPGGVFGFNFGMGLALNDKAALSLGYDHNSVGRTLQDVGAGEKPVPGSVRIQLGTLLVGLSYRYSPKTTLNVTIGAGLTRDTPDVTLSVRLPTTF